MFGFLGFFHGFLLSFFFMFSVKKKKMVLRFFLAWLACSNEKIMFRGLLEVYLMVFGGLFADSLWLIFGFSWLFN